MAAPVITVDGPSGVGKGTVSRCLADALGWHYLDSGALYRILAYAATEAQLDLDDQKALKTLLSGLNIDFRDGAELNGKPIDQMIRSEQAGENASRVARHPEIRTAMLDLQRDFRREPGLVADGRDMGTMIFPDTPHKFYLIADPEERAKRRYKQLIEKGLNGTIAALFQDIKQRDERDMNRKDSPLRPASDAVIIDTTHLSIEEALKIVIGKLDFKFGFSPDKSGA